MARKEINVLALIIYVPLSPRVERPIRLKFWQIGGINPAPGHRGQSALGIIAWLPHQTAHRWRGLPEKL